MSSNFPPGVTGFEPQIAGYPERDEVHACEAYDVKIKVSTGYAEDAIQTVINRLKAGQTTAYDERLLQDALGDIAETEVEQCPFVGEVTVTYGEGVETWTCPLCRTEHVDEADPRP